MSIELPHDNQSPGHEMQWELYAWRELIVLRSDFAELADKAQRCTCDAFNTVQSASDGNPPRPTINIVRHDDPPLCKHSWSIYSHCPECEEDE